MDAFSRAILSSDIFQSQDLSCVLIVLYAAIERFGAPKKLITDNGGVFRAKQLLAICEALDIEKEYIHARQSWEKLVETHFNVMRRMSQVQFEQVTSWQGAKLAHERFVTDYNAQPHWAHRKRDDNRLSPAEVLGQETSKLRTPEQLHRIFYATRHLRRLDRLGYVHFRRWKLYGEETLARHPAVIWLHGDALTSEETQKKAHANAIIILGRPTSKSGVIRAPFCVLDESNGGKYILLLLMSCLKTVGLLRRIRTNHASCLSGFMKFEGIS